MSIIKNTNDQTETSSRCKWEIERNIWGNHLYLTDHDNVTAKQLNASELHLSKGGTQNLGT